MLCRSVYQWLSGPLLKRFWAFHSKLIITSSTDHTLSRPWSIRHCRRTAGQNTQLLLKQTNFDFTVRQCLVSDENSFSQIPIRHNTLTVMSKSICHTSVPDSGSGLPVFNRGQAGHYWQEFECLSQQVIITPCVKCSIALFTTFEREQRPWGICFLLYPMLRLAVFSGCRLSLHRGI